MCLILLAHDAHPRYRLIVAANRDEFYARPTAPAGWWDDAPGVLAGRDLRGGGTWMGITREGRWAAVTNYRETTPPPVDAPSRGGLVGGFLLGEGEPEAYLRALLPSVGAYAGFNLLVGDGERLAYLSNRGEGVRVLGPGIYGLSNALLDTPWPKVERGKAALREVVRRGDEPDVEALLRVLADTDPAPDPLLPDTGVGVERERMLSSPFIASPEYGTRASTVLLVARDGGVVLVERTIVPGTNRRHDVRFRFRLSPLPAT
ncbi:MAG: NRDE family protein [Gemmatimonadetes bacterium]|nr:NRDE family protein [Gemmatimonadota bacterium]